MPLVVLERVKIPDRKSPSLIQVYKFSYKLSSLYLLVTSATIANSKVPYMLESPRYQWKLLDIRSEAKVREVIISQNHLFCFKL